MDKLNVPPMTLSEEVIENLQNVYAHNSKTITYAYQATSVLWEEADAEDIACDMCDSTSFTTIDDDEDPYKIAQQITPIIENWLRTRWPKNPSIKNPFRLDERSISQVTPHMLAINWDEHMKTNIVKHVYGCNEFKIGSSVDFEKAVKMAMNWARLARPKAKFDMIGVNLQIT